MLEQPGPTSARMYTSGTSYPRRAQGYHSREVWTKSTHPDRKPAQARRADSRPTRRAALRVALRPGRLRRFRPHPQGREIGYAINVSQSGAESMGAGSCTVGRDFPREIEGRTLFAHCGRIPQPGNRRRHLEAARVQDGAITKQTH